MGLCPIVSVWKGSNVVVMGYMYSTKVWCSNYSQLDVKSWILWLCIRLLVNSWIKYFSDWPSHEVWTVSYLLHVFSTTLVSKLTRIYLATASSYSPLSYVSFRCLALFFLLSLIKITATTSLMYASQWSQSFTNLTKFKSLIHTWCQLCDVLG